MITLEIPSGLLYTETHSWLARPSGAIEQTPLRTGLTPNALDGIDVASVELPAVRTTITAGLPCVLLRTVTGGAVAVMAPISGLVTLANRTIEPHLLRDDPYRAGWLFAVLPVRGTTVAGLLTSTQYRTVVSA